MTDKLPRVVAIDVEAAAKAIKDQLLPGAHDSVRGRIVDLLRRREAAADIEAATPIAAGTQPGWAMLRCNALSPGQFSDEIAAAAKDHSGVAFSLFAPRDCFDGQRMRVRVLDAKDGLVLVLLPSPTLEQDWRTVTVKADQIDFIGPLTANAELLERAERAERERDEQRKKFTDESQRFGVAYLAWRERVVELVKRCGGSGLMTKEDSREWFREWLERAEFGNGYADQLTAALAAKEAAICQLSEVKQIIGRATGRVVGDKVVTGDQTAVDLACEIVSDRERLVSQWNALYAKLQKADKSYPPHVFADTMADAIIAAKEAAETRLAEVERALAESRKGWIERIQFAVTGPHTDSEECPTWYDQCNCGIVKRMEAQIATLTRERDEARGQVEGLKDLVGHCWVHSSYPDCGYQQMDSEMRALYDAVKELPDDEPAKEPSK